jgi:hypothetical protein
MKGIKAWRIKRRLCVLLVLLGVAWPVRTSEDSCSRDCLENSWTGWIERFLVAQSVEKDAFHPVPRARGITKWNLFRVSRQSLHALG